jgi:hypothetical protein
VRHNFPAAWRREVRPKHEHVAISARMNELLPRLHCRPPIGVEGAADLRIRDLQRMDDGVSGDDSLLSAGIQISA